MHRESSVLASFPPGCSPGNFAVDTFSWEVALVLEHIKPELGGVACQHDVADLETVQERGLRQESCRSHQPGLLPT